MLHPVPLQCPPCEPGLCKSWIRGHKGEETFTSWPIFAHSAVTCSTVGMKACSGYVVRVGGAVLVLLLLLLLVAVVVVVAARWLLWL